MSEATARKLAEIAEAMCTSGRKVSPMQVAAQLLEEALARMEAEGAGRVQESGQGRDRASLFGGEGQRHERSRVAGEELGPAKAPAAQLREHRRSQPGDGRKA